MFSLHWKRRRARNTFDIEFESTGCIKANLLSNLLSIIPLYNFNLIHLIILIVFMIFLAICIEWLVRFGAE